MLFNLLSHCLCVESSALEQEFDGNYALDVLTACCFEGQSDASCSELVESIVADFACDQLIACVASLISLNPFQVMHRVN